MPPRSAKKAVLGPGQKRSSARAAKRTLQSQPESEESPAVKAEEVQEASVKEEAVEEKLEAAAAFKGLEEHGGGDPKKEAGGEVSVKKQDLKESVDDYEKDERLELEDNEPEYEPEEDGGVDYDDKEVEQEEFQDGDEVVEEFEEVEDIVEEEEEEEDGDMVEDIEDVPEELEDEGEDEEHAADKNTVNDPAEMVDEENEHHEVFKERRKRKEFEVFVGGLDKDATENDLKKVFSEVGEVTEVRLMKNPQTKKNKGFAFLRFATVEQAKRAVTELKNPVVKGKQCGVTPSQDSDTLFLGNICKTWTKEALKEKLKHCGVENVDDLTLVEDSNNVGTNRGFAFLEFSSRSDAMDAFKRLQKRDVTFGVDRAAKVSFADSFIDPGDEIMSQVKTVFVDGLPASWDEDRVREILKKYGDIEKIELARNMPSAKRKDFGFVTFNSHDAAVTCAKSINNVELGEGDTKAKVRARLSRPLQRGKGKHGGRVDFRPGRVLGRSNRGSWGRPLPLPRSLPVRIPRGIGGRVPAAIDRGVRRPIAFRDRRPPIAMPVRPRPLPLPSRSYEKRVPASSYPKSSLKRDFSRREDLPPRNRAAAEYSSRVLSERRSSFRDVYAPRGSGYTELPRSASRIAPRRSYVDDDYGQRFDRPPPSYREGRPRDYDSMSGSKRPYSSMDDVPPRYADAGGRQSRARLDYDIGAGGSQYGDTYSDRLGRSNLGYSNGRSSISSQDPHGIYGNRHEVGYARGSYSGGGGGGGSGGMYSSSFSSDYSSRGTDAGGTSYSSLYSSRGLGGSSYMGSGGSGSYY